MRLHIRNVKALSVEERTYAASDWREYASEPSCLTNLLYIPKIRNVGAHCPTNNAHWSLPIAFSVAEIAIDPTAIPRYAVLGSLDVWDSIVPVNSSSRPP
jgi:hypothetical protein